MLLGPIAAFVLCFLMTPQVKRFAENVGAIDEPNERRINIHPIPRMGGLAIFFGFVVSSLLVVNMSTTVMGLLLGAVIIAVMGALDDILTLNPWIKLAGQIMAALVAIRCGIVFDVISNPGFLDAGTTINIGWLSVPLTVLWIVLCTNAVNLIDGLDGLAVGVSAISSASMMVVSLLLPYMIDTNVPLLLACLTGACIGFMPYNLNPAKIFMGDVGSQFLGFVLSCVSIMGTFKFQAMHAKYRAFHQACQASVIARYFLHLALTRHIGECLTRLLDMQLSQVAVGITTIVVPDAVGDITGLLNFDQ